MDIIYCPKCNFELLPEYKGHRCWESSRMYTTREETEKEIKENKKDD